MKKVSIWILALVFLFLTACQPTVSPAPPSGDATTTAATTNVTTTTTTTTVATAQTTTTATGVATPLYDWAKNLPKMDGSTSTIPLEAGIRAALLGISQEEAEAQVTHNSTYGSYERLLNKECDLIFTVQMSEEQVQNARDKGIELEQVPIAAEGFVFVVNANNPVDSLTQQQLRDIYSGKITNWKQVGGNDAPIVAYQRNETSGSQNYIKIFMGDTPLMKPVTDFVPSTMGHLMDAVAYYDNAENAIGYSVYAYAADMYGNGDEIKFIHVDGVEPTKETMANGTYPLLSYNYAVYRQSKATHSSTYRLAEWLLTDEGQAAVQAAGYVPVKAVDEPMKDEKPPRLVGTGPERPDGFAPSVVHYRVWRLPLSGDSVRVLTDKTLENKVNTFISESKKTIRQYNKGSTADVSVSALNGYLSAEVELNGRTLCATWNMQTGERVALSDLFFSGENFVGDVNRALQKGLLDDTFSWHVSSEFFGIQEGYHTFTVFFLYLDRSSGYSKKLFAYFSPLYGNSVLGIANDMHGMFTDEVEIETQIALIPADAKTEPLLGNYGVQLLKKDAYGKVADTINARVRELCETAWSEEGLREYHDTKVSLMGGGMEFYELGDRWFVLRGYLFPNDVVYREEWLLFDRTTGEELPYTALLTADYKTKATVYDGDTVSDWSAIEGLRFSGFTTHNGQIAAEYCERNGDNAIYVCLPAECIK
ncbi:MAG: hypothetical protein E7549_00745 [Ruminococcaceae bacterium]|nr:hypothetical protein [Oscillospiraceae bacterium]